jgi:hypothetical protein
MCIKNYPECGDGGDGCCEFNLSVCLGLAMEREPLIANIKIHTRRIDFQRYTVKMRYMGEWIRSTDNACCPTCARAEFLCEHFIGDPAEKELNRMYALVDPRPVGPRGE